MFLTNLNSRAALYEDNDSGTEVGLQLYQFHNFFNCDLCKYNIPEVTAKDCQGVCWSKYWELLDYFGKKIAEALPR